MIGSIPWYTTCGSSKRYVEFYKGNMRFLTCASTRKQINNGTNGKPEKGPNSTYKNDINASVLQVSRVRIILWENYFFKVGNQN